jgi:hypothetical protein
MSKQEEFAFTCKAGVISTSLGGKVIELSEGETYRTSDPGEAEALRQIDGLKEASRGGKD